VALFAILVKVEQVGGPNFLEGLIGPALVAVAAIIAAGLAAWVARRNHSSQLAHDRQLRDTGYARRSIGLAVEDISEAVNAATTHGTLAWGASKASEKSRQATALVDEAPYLTYDEMGERVDMRTPEMVEAESPEWRIEEAAMMEAEVEAVEAETKAAERAMASRRVLSEQITRLAADGWKLQIYIGVKAEVVSRHQAVTHALSDWYDRNSLTEDGSWKLKDEPSIEPVAEAMAEFVKACQEWSAKRIKHSP
jgi:hypothetical protein